MHHNSTPPASPEVRLEQGEILTFSACPFPLPQADDRAFLFQQQPGARLHKNISYDPASGRVSGFQRHSAEQEARLLGLLADFSSQATRWLAGYLPCYAGGCRPDRATLRPEEEATRKLRQTARNDLLHIDAFPSRPTGGDRILRLFVNLNPTDPRVWLTSHDFAELLARFGPEVGFPDAHPGWARKFSQTVLGLLPGRAAARNAYDRFMLRLHHFLKLNEPFQEKAPRRFWKFPPGSAWLVFSDGLSHAELRGRHALEHSFIISHSVLALPEQSPLALLQRACAMPRRDQAA